MRLPLLLRWAELEEEVGGALSVEEEESGSVSLLLSSSSSLSLSVISPSSLPAGKVQITTYNVASKF